MTTRSRLIRRRERESKRNFILSIVGIFIVQPSLDPLPTATNSAKIVVSGKGEEGSTINLYVNDSVTDKEDAGDDGTFKFQVTLIKGDNKIYVKAKKNSGTSLPSDSVTIFFKNNNPSLNITSPTDGQTFSKDQNTVLVSGSTDAQ